MVAGGRDGRGRDIEPVDLSDDEIAALVAFVRTLSPDLEDYEHPELPDR